MDVRGCVEKGLLKQEAPSPEKARKSLQVAGVNLEKARRLLALRVFDMVVVNVYGSMFHASRALLFRDGFKERGHYAVYVYIKEKYGERIAPKLLNEFNVLRLERHEVFYGLEEQEWQEAALRKLIAVAGEFLESIRGLL